MTQTLRSPAPAETLDRPPPVVRRQLEQQFAACELLRPFRRACYDPGQELRLAVTGVAPAHTGRVVAEVERFVGGGFAGQVYRVRLQAIEADEEPIVGLSVGQTCAVKILKPPSGLACAFRDFLYFLGYQGNFSAQVNPAAVRVGVLWQKLIRRAAARRFGTEAAVCDTYATFYDENLHSFGEINEWVTGRTWKLEVDDQLFDRWKFDGAPPADYPSPEYACKKLFMRELVGLLHEMGAPELARQYEWWTCKSQPNALKRLTDDDSPRDGLTAIDFRAGLTLLPFLPMSPADIALIARGLAHGRLVQFDRSDLARFREFLAAHCDDFADLEPAIAELDSQEPAYRRSLPDITRHHVHLLTDGALRRSVRSGIVTSWQNLGRLDAEHADRLERRSGLFTLWYVLSLIPLLGRFILKAWGNGAYRAHVWRALTSWSYLGRTIRGGCIETVIVWHRRGRTSDERAFKLAQRPARFWIQRILAGWLPAKWHRALAEPRWAWARLKDKLSFAARFLRKPAFREAWLLEQVRQGREEGMLTEAEAAKVSHQIKDPYIQKYLKCLAVHLCTLPITHTVMLIVGVVVGAYWLTARHGTWGEAVLAGTAAAAVIQFLPISPGSLTRGLFVVYLMIRERDVRNYYVAAPVSFLHVIGYLAFPLQMVAHDPALARFMAGRWATQVVHVVPVFGERGALAEHAVFDLFFNLPISLWRRFQTHPLGMGLRTGLSFACLALFGYGVYLLLHLEKLF
jgi:hypothetical protein